MALLLANMLKMDRIRPLGSVILCSKGLIKLVALVFSLALLLTYAPTSLLFNVPLALILLTAAGCILQENSGNGEYKPRSRKSWRQLACINQEDFFFSTPVELEQQIPPTANWRDLVKSPVVEHAWETFCGSIVQEFIYDTWYATITPDKEFPAEIRRLLNHSFGQLAARARRVDLRAVLNDTSELLMEQVELYRDTREAIDNLPPISQAAARDAALKERMALDGNLHPALLLPDGDYRMLRAVADGMSKLLLPKPDRQRPSVQSAARELLAACVLKPLIMFATPYHCNKGLYRLLQENPIRNRDADVAAMNAASQHAHPNHQAKKAKQMRGTWEFEQRVMTSVRAEDDLLKATASGRMNGPRNNTISHHRSHSYDSVFMPNFDPIAENSVATETESAATTSGIPAVDAYTVPVEVVERSGGSVSSASSAHTVTSPARPARSARILPDTETEAESNGNSDAVKRPSPFDENSNVDLEAIKHHSSDLYHLIASAPVSEAGTLSDGDDERGVVASEGYYPPLSLAAGAFLELPRARVVAAELNTKGSKDYVVYKIRVADETGDEWTVSRRYRHFEVLHRQMKNNIPGYKLKLPAKRIFIHTQNVDFVEERRDALDSYLQSLLAHPAVNTTRHEVWEFLQANSEVYELLPTPGRKDVVHKSDRVRFKGDKVILGEDSIRRGLSGVSRGLLAVVGTAGAVKDTIIQGATDVTTAAVGGVGNAFAEARSSFKHRRTMSVPQDLSSVGDEISADGETMGPSKPSFKRHESLAGRTASGIIRTATASARKIKQVVVPDFKTMLDPTQPRVARTLDWEVEQQQQQNSFTSMSRAGSESSIRHRKQNTTNNNPSFKRVHSRQGSPSRRRGASPTKMRAHLPPLRPSTSEATGRPRFDSALVENDGYIGLPRVGHSSLPSSPVGGDIYSPTTRGPDQDAYPVPSLDPEDCSGISAPLYEIVDILFQLQSRGFFRRQVFGVARQVLSIALGDAVDVFLANKLRLLRQENTIGRFLQFLTSSLWPGGIWFMRTPQYLARVVLQQGPTTADTTGTPSSLTSPAHARDAITMLAENYLRPNQAVPLDADEIQEAVLQLMLKRVPSTLIRLVGQKPYVSGITDLWEMMQSETMVKQLGYGLLEVLTLHLCRELKPLFNSMEPGRNL